LLVEVAIPYKSEKVRSIRLAQWAALLVILFAEISILPYLFEWGSPASRSVVVAFFVQRFRLLLQMGIATLAAIVLFGWGRLREEFRSIDDPQPGLRFGLLTAAHVSAFSAFAMLTGFNRQLDNELALSPYAWSAIWLGMGMLTLGSWCLAALPANAWWQLLRNCRLIVLGGIGIGIAAGLAGWLTDRLWLPLSQGTLWIVHRLLAASGAEIVFDPSEFRIGTPAFDIEIEPACSGYEGIGLVCVFLAVYLWLNRPFLRFPNVLLLFPLGMLLMWLANAVRIFALIIIGSRVSADLAQGAFHSQAGWLAFIAIALGIMAATPQIAFFAAVPQVSERRPEVAYLMPFLLAIAMAMVSAALLPGLDYFYPLRVMAVAVALWVFRKRYQGLYWSWSWSAVAAGAIVAMVWIWWPWSAGGGAPDKVRTGLEQLPAAWAAAWILFRVVGYVVMIPLAEELAFRGYLMRRLISADFESVPLGRLTWFALAGSSIAFGVLHQERWLTGVVAGLAYGLVVWRRGYLSDAVWAHATTNAVLAGYVLATGQWSFMS
jgi:exosortase E/protease (VPEID-CTERM system)